MSSHLPVDLETEINRASVGSIRPSEVLSLPICRMGDKCGHITQPVIAYYGGIPSLMYCEYQNDDFSPAQRFQSYKFLAVKSKDSFLDFVFQVMEGKLEGPLHADIRCFVKLASLQTISKAGQLMEQRIHWPLC
mmetsp:Transcript_26583/g.37936  ORF Transcript_26583/g.37936 Transcript_26583/m.37936 type:complete len:134 (-) Transcript_26583:636-1037(-)